MPLAKGDMRSPGFVPAMIEAPSTAHEIRDWLRSLKEASALSYAEIAAAINEEERNVKRWMTVSKEPVLPRGDVVLKLLSALGVRFTPPAPGSVVALNAQIGEMRGLLATVDMLLETAKAADVEETAARLGSLEAKVAELPTAEDLGRAVATLQAAIDRLASRDTREVQQAKRTRKGGER